MTANDSKENSFIIIGHLERQPMLKHQAGHLPSTTLIIETGHLSLGLSSDAPGLDRTKHIVRFTGNEAGSLFRRLKVGQRLMIHATVKEASKELRMAHCSSPLIAHSIRILPDSD